ncbi:MAG: hypothetical protein ABSG04_04655, partial [Verrucomicrobiota bacterium]
MLKPFVLIASALICCALKLHGQSGPTITWQTTNQFVLPGGNVRFQVAVDGTGPFSYQWQFNGTNVPNPNIIRTVAGNGQHAYSGDGSAATNGSLNAPSGIALDAGGNLYIADGTNSVIRKVDTNGIITTVAGNGLGTFHGDGGAATNASLYGPSAVGLDLFGNLYIADTKNQCIRKVDINGLITTVAGTNRFGYAGDGSAATNARFFNPAGVASDAVGNLYVADGGNQRIREIYFAGYPTYTLTNVSTSNAGNYTVIVTSPYGSVTSLVATLTVIVPPQIITSDGFFGVVTNGFGFNVGAAAGETMVVDGSTDLVNWTPVCTNTVSANPFYFR